MRIRCPSCSATYDVPDALLDPPRTVRCAKCAHDWMAEPVVDPEPVDAEAAAVAVEAPVAALPDAPSPTERLHQDPVFQAPPVVETPLSALERLALPADLAPPNQTRDNLLTVAWAASFAIMAGLGVAAYTERDSLMRHWPASQRVYATIGLAPLDAGKDADPKGQHASDGPAR